ncbi:MAG: hypothetical protein EOM51_10595 [Clostridia bacterium]|nr:hypothetical protein [Clostridia bacterium]
MNREEAHLDQCTQEHLPQAISYLDSDEWLQLCHQPDPAGINNLRIAVSTVLSAIMGMYSVPQPDPITGLVPCGCGGVVEQTDFHDGFFPYSKVECLECGNEIMRAGNTASESHSEAKRAWNASHSYTAPPRPGAIGPDVGEMAPNGEEGARRG